MVVFREFVKAYEDIIPPAELSDPIENGIDIKFLEKLKTTLDYQTQIAKRLKMAITEINVDKIDFTTAGINSVIQTINRNFADIEKKLNEIAANSGVVDYDTSKETLLYFGNHDKTVQLKINNDAIVISSDTGTYEYSVADNLMKQV